MTGDETASAPIDLRLVALTADRSHLVFEEADALAVLCDEQQLVLVPTEEHRYDAIGIGELHRDDAVFATRRLGELGERRALHPALRGHEHEMLVILLWARTAMYVRVWRKVIRMPLLAAFAGVAVFIYLAENIATWAGAWAYPDQLDGWQPVSITKLVSWFLLMIISVVLVTWVYPPRPPTGIGARGEPADSAASGESAEVAPRSGDLPESGRKA